jgi:hypothetical protein
MEKPKKLKKIRKSLKNMEKPRKLKKHGKT